MQGFVLCLAWKFGTRYSNRAAHSEGRDLPPHSDHSFQSFLSTSLVTANWKGTVKLLPGPYSTLPVTVRLRSAAPVDNTWSINFSLSTYELVPSLEPCRAPRASASGGEYQGPGASLFSEQLSRFHQCQFVITNSNIKSCFKQFKQFMRPNISSHQYFSYIVEVFVTAPFKRTISKRSWVLKLARLARWLNIFTLVRGLFQWIRWSPCALASELLRCHCVIVSSIHSKPWHSSSDP